MSSQSRDSSSLGDTSKPVKRAKVPILAKFVIGGLAGSTGQIATHPLDVVKIYMHMTHTSFFSTTTETFRSGGIRGFYVGLTAALLRQVTYSTTRLGIYSTLLDCFRERFGRLNYPTLVSLGMISGILGSWVGTPADLVMVRMISDSKNPSRRRRCYRNAVHGLSTIIRSEGFWRMWRGAVPTIGRAAIVNGVQLATYSRTKMHLKDTNLFAEGMILQFCASMISSVITCAVSMPVDLAKTEYHLSNYDFLSPKHDHNEAPLHVQHYDKYPNTKIQSWHCLAKPPGMIKTLMNMTRNDGFFGLWRGIIPYYLRAGPNTVITMITMDQLAILYISVFSSINH